MRHSRTAVRGAVPPPACKHTPSHAQEGTHAARTEISLSRFNLIFHRLNRSPRSVLQTRINTTRTRNAHFSSSLASTSITLRSSSLRFPSPLAICSFINHHSALLLCARVCTGEGVRADLRVARGWVKVGSCACMQNHKLVCITAHGFPEHSRHVTTSCFFHVQL